MNSSDINDWLIDIYNSQAQAAVQAFYGAICDNPQDKPFTGEQLVGLLSFPNSGTSWFLQLTATASGICNHTVYLEESIDTRGGPSRGAYSIGLGNTRLPRPGQPSFVKSHVTNYGEEELRVGSERQFYELAGRWLRCLPPNCYRHVRIVRNPFDNMRARYHLYLKLNADTAPQRLMNFGAFLRRDLRRYLLWHACCDEIAVSTPVMTLHYADLLDGETSVETLLRSMRFAGYDIDNVDAERAFARFPPIYNLNRQIPSHLKFYTEEDIIWMSNEIRQWLDFHAEFRAARRGVLSRLRRKLLGD